MTALDDSGRILDRGVLSALGWGSGMRLTVGERGGLIVVAADPAGACRVTSQGFVVLPVALRHWCGLRRGDRVLVVVDPGRGWMVVHPPAALEAMVSAAHSAVWGGEPL
ncbi:AbrB/MazE/SpoVT family DNA-binding domain-containing protein [Cryptosporangium arvum]|uniref:AbrB/MazE/SpoVT family DNA-binding domain-containing protein n=1 Tax=Cryptosporangium arvum TaxID=80871 RepID=UPI0004B48C26|nr:AbrB/MazE/SpoVT family DNA-binding domain-containing protein [Cryptosporangium arvum]